MKFKGHDIEPQYLPGADFKVKNGVVVMRKPKKEHIDFYWVTPPDDGRRWTEKTVDDAKATILELEKIK